MANWYLKVKHNGKVNIRLELPDHSHVLIERADFHKWKCIDLIRQLDLPFEPPKDNCLLDEDDPEMKNLSEETYSVKEEPVPDRDSEVAPEENIVQEAPKHRGRPKKIVLDTPTVEVEDKKEEVISSESSNDDVEVVAVEPPKRRGRPRKVHTTSDVYVKENVVEVPIQESENKESVEESKPIVEPVVEEVPKHRGRPKKEEINNPEDKKEVVVEEAPKKRRGRPRKVMSATHNSTSFPNSNGLGVDHPYENVNSDDASDSVEYEEGVFAPF